MTTITRPTPDTSFSDDGFTFTDFGADDRVEEILIKAVVTQLM